MYARNGRLGRRGLGEVPSGSVAQAWAMSYGPSTNAAAQPDWIRNAIVYLQKAMDAEDIPSVLGINSALLGVTDGSPGEAEARTQGFGPGEVDRWYRAANAWVSARPNLFNQQLGPGYTQATPTGPDQPVTTAQAVQQAQAAQEADRLRQQQQNDAVKAYIANGIRGHGWDAATVAGEISRLDSLFGGVWPTVESAWNAVRPELKQFTGGFSPSSGPAPVAPGQVPVPPNVVTYPDGTTVTVAPGENAPSASGGGSYSPGASDGAPPTEGVSFAGMSGLPLLLLLGAGVGLMMQQRKRR